MFYQTEFPPTMSSDISYRKNICQMIAGYILTFSEDDAIAIQIKE